MLLSFGLNLDEGNHTGLAISVVKSLLYVLHTHTYSYLAETDWLL